MVRGLTGESIMRYIKTVTIHHLQQLNSLHIGQWFRMGDYGKPAQYLGTTRAGSDVTRYGKFNKMNAVRNGLLRAYAKALGAK